MKRKRPRTGRRKPVSCPICGNASHFAVYAATLQVHHLQQRALGRWRHLSTDPKRLAASLPVVLVCESCAHPVGPPPPTALFSIRPVRRR